MADRAARLRGSLAARIALAFVLVGLGSAAIVVIVVALTSRSETSSVVRGSRAEAAGSVRSALAAAYTAAGGDWQQADLATAVRRASAARAALIVRDRGGEIVAVSTPSGQQVVGSASGGRRQLPLTGAASERVQVRVGSRRVGSAELRFAGTELTRGERRLRDALVRNAILAALATALLALAVAAFVTRRLRGPLRRLAGAARALESGDADARVDDPRAPGELGEVAVAFDHMADALSRQHDARAAMLSDLAHELRTPLTILRGSLEELLDGDAVADPEELSSLQDEVLRLERLTADVWALSESEPSFLRLDTARVDLGDVVARAADALRQQADAAGVALRVSGRDVVVEGDARRLGQIAANLLTNALKFTPPGGTVDAAVSGADGWAHLVVADTGAGIPPDELPHVFDRFWRGRDAQGVSGTGVGLAVVQRLVQAHGGTVTAQSPPGGGARFTVRIPLA